MILDLPYSIVFNFFFFYLCLLQTGNNNEAQAFLTKGAQVIVRMRGLPYDCTAKQVVSVIPA